MTPQQREALVERTKEAVQAVKLNGQRQRLADVYARAISRAALSIAEEEIERGLIEEMMEAGPFFDLPETRHFDAKELEEAWEAQLRAFHSSRGE